MNLEYVSDINSLIGAEFFEYSEGKSRGIRACRLYNGKFSLIVLLDKAMNIFRAEYMGKNFCYVTKNGAISPELSYSEAMPFVRCFDGGLLYTCGLDNIGAPMGNVVQHGNLSNHPAENIHIERKGEILSLIGEIKVSALFGDNIKLTRKITISLNGDDIQIEDEIENLSYYDDEYVMLYHFNFGYPLLSENTKLSINGSNVSGVTELAEKETEKCYEFHKPIPKCTERVYYHKLESDNAKAEIESDDRKLTLEFSKKTFPYLLEWKSMASQDYVLGIEPSMSKFGDELKTKKIKAKEVHKNYIKLSMKQK